MSIFKVGNFSQIGISLAESSRVIKVEHKDTIRLSKKMDLDNLNEISFNIEPPKIDLATSSDKWSLYLKNLSLYESFEGFIANLFNPMNEIYFTSITWDYSGSKPFVYPPKGSKSSNFLIPMREDTMRKFIGDGVNIWPAQNVVGSLNVMIIIYESDEDVRKLGEQLDFIHDQVNNSQLAGLIVAISVNPSIATGVAIGKAVNELLGIIGNIMKINVNDYVDLFEGSYGTDKPQVARVEKYNSESSGIELDFTIS